MKGSKLVITIIEIVVVIAAVVGILLLTQSKVEPTTVYQYARQVFEGEKITAADLQTVSIPREAITKDFVLKEEDLLGKVVRSDVFPGEYVTKSHLAEETELGAFASVNLEDYVKVAIPVTNETAAGGLINSGDLVDLVFVGNVEDLVDADNSSGTYATRFMSEVLVYKVLNATANEVYNDVESGNVRYDEEGAVIENTGDGAYLVCAVPQEDMLEILARLKEGTVYAVARFDETITDEEITDFVIGSLDSKNVNLVETDVEKIEAR